MLIGLNWDTLLMPIAGGNFELLTVLTLIQSPVPTPRLRNNVAVVREDFFGYPPEPRSYETRLSDGSSRAPYTNPEK